MGIAPGESHVLVESVRKPQFEIDSNVKTDIVTRQMAVPLDQRSLDAFFANESCAFYAWISMWAGSLLLNDVRKSEIACDKQKQKLKVERRDCDCC